MKKVSETKAGQSIAAFVVISPAGKFCGRIQAHYADSGRVTVDVMDFSTDGIQQGSAGGGGYDKFTAALSGLAIDGHPFLNHCATTAESTEVLARYHGGELSEDQVRDGYPWMAFANWSGAENRWNDLYCLPGIDGLRARGYKVLQAI